MVAPPAAAPTLTVKVKVDESLDAMLLLVQLIEPVPPAEGVVQLQLDGVGMETNVVFVGIVSEKVRLVAASGPLLVTTIE